MENPIVQQVKDQVIGGKKPTNKTFLYLMRHEGDACIPWLVAHTPNLITADNLEAFHRCIKESVDYHFILSSLVWKLSRHWNQIHYRCFLWCLHKDYNTTSQTLNEVSSVFDPYTEADELNLQLRKNLDDDGRGIEPPILPTRPTDKELSFLRGLFDKNSYPLAVYQYLRNHLTPKENKDWFKCCEEKIIISYVLSSEFWLISPELLARFKERYIHFVCLKYLQVAANERIDLEAFYTCRVQNKKRDNYIATEFESQSLSEKRKQLTAAAQAMIKDKVMPNSTHITHLIYHCVQYADVCGHIGRRITLFRLYPDQFKRVIDFEGLLRDDPDSQMLWRFFVKQSPELFELICKIKGFGLSWYVDLDEECQERLKATYYPILINNYVKITRTHRALCDRLISQMTVKERCEMADRYSHSAITEQWNIPDQFWLNHINIHGHNILLFGRDMNRDIIWAAAKLNPAQALEYIRSTLTASEVKELISIRDDINNDG